MSSTTATLRVLEHVQQLTGPCFWAIVLDWSTAGQLSAKQPAIFHWSNFNADLQVPGHVLCLQLMLFGCTTLPLFVNWKVFIMCNWRFWLLIYTLCSTKHVTTSLTISWTRIVRLQQFWYTYYGTKSTGHRQAFLFSHITYSVHLL